MSEMTDKLDAMADQLHSPDERGYCKACIRGPGIRVGHPCQIARLATALREERGRTNNALRRAEAFAAFLALVEEYGSAMIDCDMESFGREPGDVVTILVAAPLGGYYSSHEVLFSAEVIRAFGALIRPRYEADAALLTGEAPGGAQGGRGE